MVLLSRVLRAAGDKAGDFMTGPGGRGVQNRAPQGMTLASLKKHKALQPLAVIMGGTILFVCFYIGRLATQTTDISWTKKSEPYNEYKNKQFQFLNPKGIDYSKISKVPDYKNDDADAEKK